MKQRFKKYIVFLPAMFLTGRLCSQQFCRTADRHNFTSTQQIPDSPNTKWRFKTGGLVIASPVLYNNTILTGSCDSNLYALNNSDGKLLWKFRAGGEIRSSVAIDNNTVFFIGTDGIFYALDVNSGKLKWTFKTAGENFYDAWDYYQSSPAINSGTVYFGCGDGFMYALNAVTGNLSWKYKTGGIVHASPTVTDNAILIGSFDGFFYCINTNGTLRWKFNTIGEQYFPLGEVQFHATVLDSTVFFCSRDYNVYALKIKNGGGHWVYHEPGSWTSVPSLSGKRLIVTTSDGHKILGFGKTYGVKLYETEVPLNVFGSASLNDSTAYVGCIDGAVYKMDIISGKSVKIFQTASGKEHFADFIDSSGNLRESIIEKYRDDVTPLYTEFLKMGCIFSTPWIDNGVLYFGSADGYVYALG
jgi:outer membrane protein assembly factor BamB